jgi:hypothetical protein
LRGDSANDLIEGGGHGMLFGEFTSSSNQLPGGRKFYRAHGAPSNSRAMLQKIILEFIESKI